MVIVTLDHCIICYNLCNLESFTELRRSEGEKIAKRFYTLATRYLHLDPGDSTPEKTFTTGLSGDGSNVTQVCHTCFPLLNSFCSVYHQWEKLELELNARLDTVAECIRLVDGVYFRGLAKQRNQLQWKLSQIGSDLDDADKFRSNFLEEGISMSYVKACFA